MGSAGQGFELRDFGIHFETTWKELSEIIGRVINRLESL